GLGAPASDPWADGCDACPRRPRGRPAPRARHAAGPGAAPLAAGLVRGPSAALLRLGPAHRLAAEPRARPADPRGPRLLVAGLRRAAPPAPGRAPARAPPTRVSHTATG